MESMGSRQIGCNLGTQAGKAKDHKFKTSLGHIVSSSQLVVRAYLKNTMKTQPALKGQTVCGHPLHISGPRWFILRLKERHNKLDFQVF